MGEALTSQWTTVDAWILACVTRDWSSVEQLIAGADALDHSIPTHREFTSSIGALMQSGLVEAHGLKFRLTSAGHAIREHWSGGFSDWAAALVTALQVVPRGESSLELSVKSFDDAYQRYWSRPI